MRAFSLLWSFIFCVSSVVSLSAELPKDFTIESPTHGTKFTLSEAPGKTVVLHFLLKTECPYCLRYTQSYAKESLDSPDVTHIFLKPDSTEEIKKWASSLDTKVLEKAPVIYRDPDAKLAKAYDIPDGYEFHGQSVHFPALVALDSSGNELFRYVGKDNSDRLSYREFLQKLKESRSEYSALVPRRLLPLIHANEVQRELNLSDEEIVDLEMLFARLDGRWFRSRIMPSNQQTSEIVKLETEFWSWARTAWKPERIKRLKQIELQSLGSRMFLREDVVSRMKLTSSQTERIAELARATENAQMKRQAAESNGQSNQDLGKMVADAVDAEQRGTVQTLLDAQKQQLTQALGPVFDTQSLKRIYPMAPDFAKNTQWFNSQPLTMEDLRGKVVLVHFYAFQCHNCHANFAIYKRWHEELQNKGVVVIGIQSPETAEERDPEAVRRAATERGLKFPIIMDGEMKNWNSWANTMWPTVYVVDKHGYLRHWWQGELNWKGAQGDQTIEKIVETLSTED